MHPVITDFHIIRPSFELSQEETLAWIAKAHKKAEGKKQNKTNEDPEMQIFHEELKSRLYKLGIGKEKIQKRGLEFADFSHLDWEKMEIFSFENSLEGANFTKRSALFDTISTKKFEEFYPENAKAPDHLIHVTCTGYVAPSGAQKIISKRDFGKKSIVTHAYHMGCYGAMPAIRMAQGFFHTSPTPTAHIDIVHTEVCSLHMNPLLHETEQLVVQTLFADGFIKYSLLCQQSIPKGKPYFTILCTLDEIVPNTLEKMTWKCESWGLRMTISKDIPILLGKALPLFAQRLFEKAGLSKDLISQSLFAIHPGGPKIISQVANLLGLQPDQISHSEEILTNFGNMSSATLPHIWEKVLKDDKTPSETLIVSLAFGPGLNISGSLMRKSTGGELCTF
jgi:predicted naringenin-chalcone synthase